MHNPFRMRFISIKYKLLMYFLLIVIIPVSVISVNYLFSSQKIIEQKTVDFLQEVTRQSNQRIEDYLKDIESISNVAAYHPDIQDFLKDKGGSINSNLQTRAYEVLYNAIQYKSNTYSINIYNLNNSDNNLFVNIHDPVNFKYNPIHESWFQQIKNSKNYLTILNTHQDLQSNAADNWVIAAGRNIYNLDDGRLLGVMVFNIRLEFVNKIVGDILNDKKTDLNIISNDGNVIYSKDYKYIASSIVKIIPVDTKGLKSEGGFVKKGYDGISYIYAYNSFHYVPWKTLLSLSSDSVSAENALIRKRSLYILIILIVFLGLISFIISNHISNPVRRLIQNMAKVKKGVFEGDVVIRSNDEVGMLVDRFNDMKSELNRLIQQIYVEQSSKTQAEIKALQAQINPHFLYNTLNSVKWIATLQKSDKIVEITEALIHMLRFAAGNTEDLVTFRDEIENIKKYMSIQNIRYYKRLDFSITMDPEIENYKILKFTLQPIIENAIFHGLAEKDEGGAIRLHITKELDLLHIMIEDNGVGMDKETQQEIETQLSHYSQAFKQIGISNVHRRIKMVFGDIYGIRFTSELGKGTSFHITLPAMT